MDECGSSGTATGGKNAPTQLAVNAVKRVVFFTV